jgi:phosphodiesterase/alkaline phosphatase D-like protein
VNPTIKGSRLRIQINETTEGSEWQVENYKTAAKRRGAEGEFITHEGQYIYSDTNVVLMPGDVAPKHTVLTPDAAGVTSKSKIEEEVGM